MDQEFRNKEILFLAHPLLIIGNPNDMKEYHAFQFDQGYISRQAACLYLSGA
ncbi:MAG: hypothetical protein RR346_11015 [Bacteroidales bacterium]